MSGCGPCLEHDDLKSFLKPLSQVTGLCMSFFPPGSDREELIIGESPFCLQLKANPRTVEKCHAHVVSIRAKAAGCGQPVFDLCHARMGSVAVPLASPEGADLGSIMIHNALLHGLTEEHKEFIRDLAGRSGIESTDSLISAAGESPVFTRSRLQALAGFIQSQLIEKATTRNTLEDTTEYLLEKYEELMFLYAITENIMPEKGSQKAFSVILDKGMQKLDAAWAMLLLAEEDRPQNLEILEKGGNPPVVMRGGSLNGIFRRILSCTGPATVRMGAGDGLKGENILNIPFRVKNMREGYLVFGFSEPRAIKEADMRFTVALSRQASSVLYAVGLYRDLADLLFATLGALSSAIDAKDPYTHGHSWRVAEYSVKTARHMGHDSKFLTMLKIAGQLHDFGKIGIREHILGKRGGLNEEERKAMEEHPVIGAHILGRFKPFFKIVPGIRHHHERYDGTGYPDGVSGDRIPMVGRIIAVADAFDAMTTSRPYRRELSREEALEELRKTAGSQFDPFVVKAFINAVGRETGG